MRTVFYILFASAFTTAVSYAFGGILLQIFSIPELSRLERRLFSFLTGAAALSLFVFLLCAVHLALKGVFLAGGLVVLLVAWRVKPAQASTSKLPGRLLVFVPVVVFGFIYLVNALAPEVSPDGSAYHLAFVARYYKWHGFQPITTNMYANMPQAMEMLFLFAYAFGRHSAAAMVHLTFLFALALLLWSFGARRGQAVAGAAAGAIVFLSPVFGVDASSAYNDVALAAAGFGCFYLLEIWRESNARSALILSGVLAGFCFGLKYTGVFVLAYALIVVRPKKWIPLLIPFAVMSLPWLIKAAIVTHNPFSPFFNAIFPNPYIHVSFEREYSELMRGIGLAHPRTLPWSLAWTGAPGGALGPIFLLLPLGLLSLRRPDGRRLCLAAVVFAMAFPFNTETRFLMLSAPVLALLITSAIPWGPLLYVLAGAQAIFAFPPMFQKLKAPSCWAIEEIPIRAALRLEPEEKFLERRLSEYDMARFIEKTVPSEERVLALTTATEAYTARNILVYYESAEAELERLILLTPLYSFLQPDQIVHFSFASSAVKSVRILATSSDNDSWTMSEMYLIHNGVRVPYSVSWRSYASPNPWDTSLALDGNLTTRWSSWRAVHPGMFYSIDFAEAQTIDSLEIQWHPSGVKFALDLLLGDGSRMRVDQSSTAVYAVPDLRKSATRAIRQRGTRYLMVPNSDPLAGEFLSHQQQWGISMLGEWGNARLYLLE